MEIKKKTGHIKMRSGHMDFDHHVPWLALKKKLVYVSNVGNGCAIQRLQTGHVYPSNQGKRKQQSTLLQNHQQELLQTASTTTTNNR